MASKRLDDDDEIARDGETVRVPLMLCDSLQRAVAGRFAFDADAHRPRHGQPTPKQIARRQSTRDAYVRGLTTAWKCDQGAACAAGPGPAQVAPGLRQHLYGTGEDVDDREAAYRDGIVQMTNAWRMSGSRPTNPSVSIIQPQPPDKPVGWMGGEVDLGSRQPQGSTAGFGKVNPNRAEGVEAMRERTIGEDGVAKLACDLETKRRATHRQFTDALENAWKTPS